MKSPVLCALLLVALCLFAPRVNVYAQFLVEVDCPPWQNPNRPPPDIIIGSFIWGTPTMEFPMSMISDILKDIPSNNQNPLVVAIAPGTYNGTMTIRAANVTLIGCGADKTFLTDLINNGISQSTVTVSASDVTIEHMQIANHKNDAWQLGPNPPGGNIQAVALTVDRNTQRTIVRFSYIYGFQDTLQSRGGYLYMYNSTVLGKTDFIFGSGVMYLENCTIEAIPGGGYITAPNGPQYQMYGIVIVNPLIITKMGYNFWVNQTWGFGRGWQNYPMATFINAVIDDSTYFTNARAWWNVGTQAPTASSSVCMSRFAEYGTKFLRNPPAVDWKIQHPQSCPNYTEPWVNPIIARDTMTNDEVIFYRKTNVLAGWNPVADSTPKPPVVASSSGAPPAASSSAENVFSSSAPSASSSAWWKVLSSSAATFFSSAPAATSSSSSSIPPVIVTPTPIDDVLGTLIPLHGPASSYDAANVHTVSEALRDADLSGYLEQLAPNPSTELDDALFEWHLPFAFHIGGATTHTAYVSTNGNLQFGSGMHSYRFVPEPLPKGDGELLPLLSYLFTDLQSTVANEFYVATLGVEPRRAALLRVPSVTTPTSRGVTALDVLLFEGLDRIEIRYYYVHEFHEPVLIALQPPVTDDFVVLWNAKPLDARALKALNGSTIVFQPRAAFV